MITFDSEFFKFVAAVIGLPVAVLVAVTAYLQYKRAKKELEKAKAEAEKARLDAETAKRNIDTTVESIPEPFTMREWHGILALSTTGDATITRRCVAIKQSGLSGDDCRIPYSLYAPEKGSMDEPKFCGPPPRPAGALLRETDKQLKKWIGEVFIPRSTFVAAADADVGICIEQKVTGAFYLTEEDAAAQLPKQFPYESFGTTLTVSAEKVIVEVSFPEGYEQAVTSAFAAVFYGDHYEKDLQEIDRIAGKLRKDGRTVTLPVPGPQRGRRYCVAWTPPPAGAIRT